MKGMKASTLLAIIDFLYLGEANVFQEELDSFLVLAEELQLKGFGGISEETFQEHQTEERTNMSHQQNMPESRISDVKYENDKNLFQGTVVMTNQQKTKQDSLIEPATMARIDTMIEKREGRYNCKNCGHTSKHLFHTREHVEKHIEGLEYPCTLCNKVLRSSLSFREHKRRCPPIIFS